MKFTICIDENREEEVLVYARGVSDFTRKLEQLCREDVALVFSGIFLVIYFAVWTVVYLCVRTASRRLNRNLP